MAIFHADRTDMALASRLPITQETEQIPLTYQIGETVYHGIPAAFSPKMKRIAVDSNITRFVFTGSSPEGVTVSAEATVYHDFPAVEWIAYFTNSTGEKSPIVSDIRWTTAFRGANPVLYHSNGDTQATDGFETYRDAIGQAISLTPVDGHSNKGAFPYMRVCMDDWFVNLAIGWAGMWTASFAPADGGVSVSVGQKRCHMTILPGETMRTPSVLFLAAGESDDHARNLWRKFYFAHLLPKDNGKPLGPMQSVGVANPNFAEFAGETTESQLAGLETYLTRGPKPDIWWIDAGWYPCPYRWWASVGDWFADPVRFPEGLAPIGQKCAENGVKFLLWFEPERVRPGTFLHNEHPEWLLPVEEMQDFMLDLGNPDAVKWLTDHVCSLINEYKINIYRQDFNHHQPIHAWERAEADDRIGAMENQHIQGYLAFWDALLDRNPGLIIDSCAGGGRRNELDAMRRSVPLHYTDVGYGHHPVKQKQYRLMFEWIPYFRGQNTSWDYPDGHYATGDERNYGQPYDAFSSHNAMTPARSIGVPVDATEEMLAVDRVMLPIWKRAAEIELRADYYPLTECRKDPHDWYAMQFDDPDEGDGFVQIVRNTMVDEDTFVLRMKAIRPDCRYAFENPETGEAMTLTDGELEGGIALKLAPRSGAVWFYRTV